LKITTGSNRCSGHIVPVRRKLSGFENEKCKNTTRMKTYINPEENTWDDILKRPLFNVGELTQQVQVFLNDIKTSGIEAIRKYTEKFDGVFISDIAVGQEEITEAINLVDETLKESILTAAGNIRKFSRVTNSTNQQNRDNTRRYLLAKTCAHRKSRIVHSGRFCPTFFNRVDVGYSG
jgi:hypothetical protein